MQAKKLRESRRPEDILRGKIIDFLRTREWHVIIMHGNEFQKGVPDLLCCHHRYGIRLVEVKVLSNYHFTPAQLKTFPQLVAHGAGVWIMTDATEEEYSVLFRACNWAFYLKF